MSRIEVRHSSRNRVYVRRFDHDEAARRAAAGERIRDLAEEYGVTKEAVYQAIQRRDPAQRAAFNAYKRQWYYTVCDECGGPATNPGGARATSRSRRCLCLRCSGVARRERFRFDDAGRLIAVRCELIECANGDRWQPPENFAGHTQFRDVRPKGIHGTCRACNTRMKRAWRERTGRLS